MSQFIIDFLGALIASLLLMSAVALFIQGIAWLLGWKVALIVTVLSFLLAGTSRANKAGLFR